MIFVTVAVRTIDHHGFRELVGGEGPHAKITPAIHSALRALGEKPLVQRVERQIERGDVFDVVV